MSRSLQEVAAADEAMRRINGGASGDVVLQGPGFFYNPDTTVQAPDQQQDQNSTNSPQQPSEKNSTS